MHLAARWFVVNKLVRKWSKFCRYTLLALLVRDINVSYPHCLIIVYTDVAGKPYKLSQINYAGFLIFWSSLLKLLVASCAFP